MREIKFRGKRTDNGEWVTGWYLEAINYLSGETKPQIGWIRQAPSAIDRNIPAFEPIANDVDPATVGQYTGLKDKNGKEIYEGDIVNRRSGEYWQGYYEFDDAITISDLMDIVTTAEFESLLVIGNIHDNPELLEGGRA